jgi:hypothetical protein
MMDAAKAADLVPLITAPRRIHVVLTQVLC